MNSSDDGATITILPLTTTSVNVSMMTAGFGPEDMTRAICGTCSGKKFDPKHGGGVRKCQRCRGRGFTTVGKVRR